MGLRVHFDIDLALDGGMWGALIGPNLVEGESGWGDTPFEALRDLTTVIGKETAGMDPGQVVNYLDQLHRGTAK